VLKMSLSTPIMYGCSRSQLASFKIGSGLGSSYVLRSDSYLRHADAPDGRS